MKGTELSDPFSFRPICNLQVSRGLVGVLLRGASQLCVTILTGINMEIHAEYLNWFRNETMIFFLKQKLIILLRPILLYAGSLGAQTYIFKYDVVYTVQRLHDTHQYTYSINNCFGVEMQFSTLMSGCLFLQLTFSYLTGIVCLLVRLLFVGYQSLFRLLFVRYLLYPVLGRDELECDGM